MVKKSIPHKKSRRQRHFLLSPTALFLLAVAFLPKSSMAGYSEGGAFISPGYGARAWGMGGAVVASVNDESAIYWNPAFLSNLETSSVGLAYVNLVKGIDAHQAILSYARIIKDMPEEEQARMAKHAAGIMYGNLSLDLPEGLGYSENYLRAAYAYTPDFFLSIGVAADFLISRSDLPEFDSKGSALHLGLRVKLTKRLNLGLIARNVFSRIMFSDGHDQTMERTVTIGFSARLLTKLLLESDTEFAYGAISRTIIGGEYELVEQMFFLRAAFSIFSSGETRAVPYFGLGVKIDRFSLHYNADLDSEEALADTHRFTLSIRI